MQNTKSATTAGLLGIFLGAFGAHNWYLGEKNKGIAHVCMMAGGILVEIIASIILPNVLSISMLLTAASILGIIGGIASLAMTASGIWGLVEGIQILVGGDAGLAAKGYPVNMPMNNQGYNNYNQPGYGQPNYGPQQPGYGPVPNQGYYGQQPNMNQPQNPAPNQNVPQPNNTPNEQGNNNE